MGLFRRGPRPDEPGPDIASPAPLFAALSLAEKREALEINAVVFEGVLRSRRGEVNVIDGSPEGGRLLDNMTDEDLRVGRELALLSATATSTSDDRQSIRLYRQILEQAPFDSIGMMSIGVRYAYLGDRHNALAYLRRALDMDPENPRIQKNLVAVSQSR